MVLNTITNRKIAAIFAVHKKTSTKVKLYKKKSIAVQSHYTESNHKKLLPFYPFLLFISFPYIFFTYLFVCIHVRRGNCLALHFVPLKIYFFRKKI